MIIENQKYGSTISKTSGLKRGICMRAISGNLHVWPRRAINVKDHGAISLRQQQQQRRRTLQNNADSACQTLGLFRGRHATLRSWKIINSR